MRRAVSLLALVGCLAAAAPAAALPTQVAFAFGRTGGSILPFAVTIASSGAVRVSGPVRAGQRTLTSAELLRLTRLAKSVRFSSLPATTRCPATLPDVATTFVQVGLRTVRVHGSCVPRFTRLWSALSAAVRLVNATA